MKRLLLIILCAALLLSGCAPAAQKGVSLAGYADVSPSTSKEAVETSSISETELPHDTPHSQKKDLHFSGLGDAALLSYAEDNIYSELVGTLNSEKFFVENVQAIYLSEEYIEELEYNSKENLFFGYTLSELSQLFQGHRYIFTLGDDGQTSVIPLEELHDDTYEQVIKNVAVGSGVILVSVTISIVSAGASPAISMIFATASATGTAYATQSGSIAFIAAALARGYQTQDFDEAIKAGAVAGSKSFKWGAISGSIAGGATEALSLKGAARNGLTMDEAALIQKASKWPLDAIKNIHSVSEYNIYKTAELVPVKMSDGSWIFTREIDWGLLDSFGRTNTQRVLNGLAPLDSTGTPFELHHIGQKADSPLAILTQAEHHNGGNFKILHYQEAGKNVSDAVWSAQKKEVWSAILNNVVGTIS